MNPVLLRSTRAAVFLPILMQALPASLPTEWRPVGPAALPEEHLNAHLAAQWSDAPPSRLIAWNGEIYQIVPGIGNYRVALLADSSGRTFPEAREMAPGDPPPPIPADFDPVGALADDCGDNPVLRARDLRFTTQASGNGEFLLTAEQWHDSTETAQAPTLQESFLLTSVDGRCWTQVPLPGAPPEAEIPPVGMEFRTRDLVQDGTQVLLCGTWFRAGFRYGPPAYGPAILSYSPTEGVRERYRGRSTETEAWVQAAAVDPSSGALVAVGTRGLILHSPDGWQWTAVGLPTDLDWHEVRHGPTGWLATGAYGLLGWSADGRIWSTNLHRFDLFSVAFGHDRFVVYGEGRVLLSETGETWEEVPLSPLRPTGQLRFTDGVFSIPVPGGRRISPDGRDWSWEASGEPWPAAEVRWSGRLLAADGATLRWTAAEDQPATAPGEFQPTLAEALPGGVPPGANRWVWRDLAVGPSAAVAVGGTVDLDLPVLGFAYEVGSWDTRWSMGPSADGELASPGQLFGVAASAEGWVAGGSHMGLWSSSTAWQWATVVPPSHPLRWLDVAEGHGRWVAVGEAGILHASTPPAGRSSPLGTLAPGANDLVHSQTWGWLWEYSTAWYGSRSWGWFWTAAEDGRSLYLFHPALGWLWTSRDLWPCLYEFSHPGWACAAGTSLDRQRFLYRFAEEQWTTWPDAF